MTEIWKQVPRWPLYEVSSHGRVRKGKRVLKPEPGRTGYLRVTLIADHNKRQRYNLHRLVAIVFHGDPPPEHIVRHLNGLKWDNRAENLKWGTHRQNAIDVILHGYHNKFNQTHCINNHPLEGDNLRIVIREYRRPYRMCRACHRERNRRYRSARV